MDKSIISIKKGADENFITNCIKEMKLIDKYIKDKKAKVFVEDPYRNSSFILEEEHLFQTWCKIYGIEYN